MLKWDGALRGIRKTASAASKPRRSRSGSSRVRSERVEPRGVLQAKRRAVENVGSLRDALSKTAERWQRWVAVEVAGHNGYGGELAVLLSTGRRIEVKRGFDAGTLRQLVAVLEQV